MKALKGINFGEIAMSAAGNLAGLAVATQLNRVPAIAKQNNPKVKGAILFVLGKVGVPMLAKMGGFAGKKGMGELVKGAGDGLAIVGLAQIGNSVAPNIFPAVSGYEDGVYGGENMGLVVDEDMNGLEGVGANDEVYD